MIYIFYLLVVCLGVGMAVRYDTGMRRGSLACYFKGLLNELRDLQPQRDVAPTSEEI